MFGDGGVGKEAKRARQEEEARQRRISEGTAMVRGKFSTAFDDNYYKTLQKNFEDAYAPELEDQYKTAYDQMQAALMRAGLDNSSEAARREKLALKAKDKATQAVAAQGNQAVNQRKQDVAYTENTILNQLANTADSSAAFANATAQIKSSTTPLVTPMLGQVITDLGAGLATQAEMERNNQNRYTVFGRIPGWSNPNRYTRNVGG